MMASKNRPIIFPTRLKPGNTIGITAPASHFNKDLFNQGLSVLKDMGFKLVVPDGVFNKRSYLAGSDEQRAEVVNQLFADDAIDAIVCARGGFGSMKILSLLDYDIIRCHPKICVGFSDISALLYALHAETGLVTFHGPTVTTLARANPFNIDAFTGALSAEDPLKLQAIEPMVIRPGRAEGPIMGGNLTTLCHLTGTAYAPSFGSAILFIEDRGEATYRIDRMLTQMKMAGCFNGLAGLILGSFTDCGDFEPIVQVVTDLFKEDTFPIMAGFPIGHGADNVTVPIGLPAALDTAQQTLSFDQPATLP